MNDTTIDDKLMRKCSKWIVGAKLRTSDPKEIHKGGREQIIQSSTACSHL
jgi:hypothetical protein